MLLLLLNFLTSKMCWKQFPQWVSSHCTWHRNSWVLIAVCFCCHRSWHIFPPLMQALGWSFLHNKAACNIRKHNFYCSVNGHMHDFQCPRLRAHLVLVLCFPLRMKELLGLMLSNHCQNKTLSDTHPHDTDLDKGFETLRKTWPGWDQSSCWCLLPMVNL